MNVQVNYTNRGKLSSGLTSLASIQKRASTKSSCLIVMVETKGKEKKKWEQQKKGQPHSFSCVCLGAFSTSGGGPKWMSTEKCQHSQLPSLVVQKNTLKSEINVIMIGLIYLERLMTQQIFNF